MSRKPGLLPSNVFERKYTKVTLLLYIYKSNIRLCKLFLKTIRWRCLSESSLDSPDVYAEPVQVGLWNPLRLHRIKENCNHWKPEFQREDVSNLNPRCFSCATSNVVVGVLAMAKKSARMKPVHYCQAWNSLSMLFWKCYESKDLTCWDHWEASSSCHASCHRTAGSALVELCHWGIMKTEWIVILPNMGVS